MLRMICPHLMYYHQSYELFFFFFSSRRRHTRCALVTGVQTCALPILLWPLAAAAASAMRHRTLSASGVRGNMRHHPPPYVEGGPIPQENSMASLSRPLRHTLAAALALAAAPVFAQGDSPYSNTVFFGDSLTDSEIGRAHV